MKRIHVAGWLLAIGAVVAGAAIGQERSIGPLLQLRVITTIEGEALVSRAKASAGAFAVQDMSGFGPQWSGGAQLFWRPPAPVDQPLRNWPNLTLPLEVPRAGLYHVKLHFTTAPDYGSVVIFLRGKPVADFAAYSPAVALRELSLGRQQLEAGSNQLVLTVFSKIDASSNYFVGLDRIVAEPAD